MSSEIALISPSNPEMKAPTSAVNGVEQEEFPAALAPIAIAMGMDPKATNPLLKPDVDYLMVRINEKRFLYPPLCESKFGG